MLAGLLRKRYGLRGAEAFVRLNGFAVVNRAVSEYEELVEEGTEIRNAAGFIIWFVRQLRALEEVAGVG